jgi:hypothetical protein
MGHGDEDRNRAIDEAARLLLDCDSDIENDAPLAVSLNWEGPASHLC